MSVVKCMEHKIQWEPLFDALLPNVISLVGVRFECTPCQKIHQSCSSRGSSSSSIGKVVVVFVMWLSLSYFFSY